MSPASPTGLAAFFESNLLVNQANALSVSDSVSDPVSGSSFQVNSGYVAIAVTLLIWSSFFISLQVGGQHGLGLLDLATLRYGVPALGLLPLFIIRFKKIFSIRKRYLIGMLAGAGLPYFILSGTAVRMSSVAEGSTLIPGTIPLFVTGMAVIFYKETVSKQRGMGISLIVMGVGAMMFAALFNANADQMLAYSMFLLCSLLWAIFTISMRLSGITAMEGAALFSTVSIVALGAWVYSDHSLINWQVIGTQTWWMQFLMQGIAVGFLAALSYGHAIQKLGAEVSAAFGSLTPVVASVMAMVILAETVSFSTVVGMLLITTGVLFASEIFSSKHKSN